MISISQHPVVHDVLERSMVGVPYESEADYALLINAIKEGYLLRFGKTIQDQAEAGWTQETGTFVTKAEKEQARK